MSTKSLRDHLIQTLNRLKPADRAVRVAVLGIGNELHGDDAAGILAARALPASENLLVIEAGPAPENTTGALRRFRPDLVLLVDAAHFADEPGTVSWFDWQQTDGLSGSTHTLPPSVLAQFLVGELACRLALLVIQPAQIDFGCPLSAPVRAAGDRVVDALVAALRCP